MRSLVQTLQQRVLLWKRKRGATVILWPGRVPQGGSLRGQIEESLCCLPLLLQLLLLDVPAAWWDQGWEKSKGGSESYTKQL